MADEDDEFMAPVEGAVGTACMTRECEYTFEW
jgi:hypothetical protein